MTLGTEARWLHEFAATAAKTDSFTGKPDHAALLAAGLIGEAGSVVSELKKARRERDAYPVYRERMVEEVGDFLWYFVRLAAVVAPDLLEELPVPDTIRAPGGRWPPDHGAPRLRCLRRAGPRRHQRVEPRRHRDAPTSHMGAPDGDQQ